MYTRRNTVSSNKRSSRQQRNRNSRNRAVARSRSGGESYDNTLSRPMRFQPPSSLIFRGIGMPDRFETTLLIKEDAYHFSGSAIPAANVWRCNSLFDPDLTGGGQQPNYFDQLSAIYGQYFVKEFWAELDINNQSTTITANYVCLLSETDISANAVENLSESKYAISGMIGPTGSVSTKKIRFPLITTRHLFGQPVPESDNSLFASTTANPTDVGYFIFKANATDGASSINLYVNVKLFYRSIFKELILPGES